MRNMWMKWIGIVLVVVGCDGQGETSAVSVEDSPVAAEEGVVSEEETETVEETPKKDGVEAPAESLVCPDPEPLVCPEPADCACEEEESAGWESLELNLYSMEDNLTAFTKMRGSLNPNEEVVFYWTGNIYDIQDADPLGAPLNDYPGPILRFEGFNIARFVPVPGGVRMISREVSVYKDLYGNIIDCWDNSVLKPETPQDVPVVHVWNDPVNFTISGGNGVKVGEQVVWTTEVFLNYPSPLPVNQYPEYSAGNTYQSSEIFKFFSQWEDLNDPTQNSVPVTLTWSRVGQYLPWMQMGQQPGKLVYHTHGFKVMDGFDGLPQALKDFVLERDPKFQFAPDTDVSPNETSWKVFKKKFESGEYDPVCSSL